MRLWRSWTGESILRGDTGEFQRRRKLWLKFWNVEQTGEVKEAQAELETGGGLSR
jgi:hypothetical protein